MIVLGPHRTGTSATAGALRLLGVELGDSMLPASTDNASGFWEHSAVFDRHERLLAELGSTWHDLRPLPDGWVASEPGVAFAAWLGDFLCREFSGKPLWGVKDPRLCRLLPAWLPVLEQLGVSADYVITLRAPLDSAQSLCRRNGFSVAESILLYLDSLVLALQHTEDRRRILVSYADLLEDSERSVDRLIGFLGVGEPQQSQALRSRVVGFLDPSLRHHRAGAEEVRRCRSLLHWADELFEHLESSSRRDAQPDGELVERITGTHRAALELYLPILDQLHHWLGDTRAAAARDAAQSAATRERLETELGQQAAARKSADEQVARLDSTLREHEREVARLGDEAVRLERQLVASEAQAERRTAELSQRIDQLERRLLDAEAVASRIRQERDRSREREADRQTMLDRSVLERDGLEEQRQRLEERSDRLKRENEALQLRLSAILSSRLYRYSRPLRLLWSRFRGENQP